MPRLLSEETLEQNLASYIEANAISSPNDYKVAREVQISRSALEEARKTVLLANAILKQAIESVANAITDDNIEQKLNLLVRLSSTLEDKSIKLINACKQAAQVSKTAIEIESLLTSKLDAAQVYSVVSQLPTLLFTICKAAIYGYFTERSLSVYNGRQIPLDEIVHELSHTLSNSFNDELEKSLNVLTYKQGSVTSVNNNITNAGTSVIEAQVVAMLNTVPLSNTDNNSVTSDGVVIVDEDSDVAKVIKTLEATQ